MVLPLTSRFSVLSVDDDDDEGGKKNVKSQSKKKLDQNLKQPMNQIKQKQDQKKKNKKPDNQINQIQNPAQQKKNKLSGTQKKKKSAAADQWELWKEKDAQLLDGNYEHELHQAILLSQLDYEEKKDVYEELRKQQENEKKSANPKKKKNNKAQTMSLSEFNSLPDSLQAKQQDIGGGDADSSSNVNGQPESDPEFFERIRQDAKKVFSHEKAIEKRKAKEPLVNDAITIAQFEDQIERRDKEILVLKKEISRLTEEIRNVKTRNKQLCQILGQGEMKDKAEVLVQMEKTQKVKDELSSEVERLHALLEQERSKVRALTGDKAKGKNKKRTASENQ